MKAAEKAIRELEAIGRKLIGKGTKRRKTHKKKKNPFAKYERRRK